MKRRMILTTAVAVCLAGSAYAQDAKASKGAQNRNPQRLFKALDKNGDGALTKSELPERLRLLIDRLDRNNDGRLTPEELPSRGAYAGPGMRPGAPPAANASETMRAMDKNRDGKIARLEAGPRLRQAFGQIDANGDGFVTVPELQRAMNRQTNSTTSRKPQSSERLKRFDKNGDGKLSKKEAPSFMKKAFDRLDADNDGFVTSREFASVMKEESTSKPSGPALTPQAAAYFSRLDRNRDGELAKSEIPDQLRQRLTRLDNNYDGTISKEEFAKGMELARRNRGPTGPSPRELFNRQDGDADGRLTRDEAQGAFKEKFDELDANKDGKLDVLEVESKAAVSKATD